MIDKSRKPLALSEVLEALGLTQASKKSVNAYLRYRATKGEYEVSNKTIRGKTVKAYRLKR